MSFSQPVAYAHQFIFHICWQRISPLLARKCRHQPTENKSLIELTRIFCSHNHNRPTPVAGSYIISSNYELINVANFTKRKHYCQFYSEIQLFGVVNWCINDNFVTAIVFIQQRNQLFNFLLI